MWGLFLNEIYKRKAPISPTDQGEHSTKKLQKHFQAIILIDQYYRRLFYCFGSKDIKVRMCIDGRVYAVMLKLTTWFKELEVGVGFEVSCLLFGMKKNNHLVQVARGGWLDSLKFLVCFSGLKKGASNHTRI